MGTNGMDTQQWLEDFMQRMQHIEDDIVASMLVKTVGEYFRMTAMSPDMDDWFMEYAPENDKDLSTLATALELRIRSHQANGEMMMTPQLMILMFTCKGITDPSLTADVVKLWDALKRRGRKHIQSVAWLMDDSISEEMITSAKGFEPTALYQRHQLKSNEGGVTDIPSTPTKVSTANHTQRMEQTLHSTDKSLSASKFLLIPIAFCLLGVLPLPYDYYLLLRVAVCASSALVAYYDFKHGNESWIIFAIVGALFNPFVPVHLNKPIWIGIDLATAGLFYWRYQRG